MEAANSPGEGFEWTFADDLYSSENTRGVYNPLHFVVRLRREFQELLESSPSKIVTPGPSNADLLLAFSTYFHETIHWWQHIGSTTGLVLSLVYPAQAHVNHTHLLKVLSDLGPRKSLKSLLLAQYHHLPSEPRRELNIILNNWHDVEFSRRIILDPMRIDAVISSSFFDCIGHSYEIGIAHTLWLLVATVDPDHRFLPDFRRWEDGFGQLKRERIEGFYYGSPIKLVPLGATRLFEGQARFNQLQYLHLASAGALEWDDFRRMGMCGEVYTTAFELFLNWTGLPWPDTPTHPTVCLFLLLCDLAINPCDGFPFDITAFESFIKSNDPSFRFMWFSRQVAANPQLKDAIQHCTRSEYLEVSTELCRSMDCRQPVEMAQRVQEWVGSQQTLKQLLQEEEAFDYRPVNLPVRVCFAKYLRFAQDRVRRPEFFCWPAMHSITRPRRDVDLQNSIELFDRHGPLFMAHLDGEIRPTLVTGRDEAKIYQAFNNFYCANVVYDMVRQWTVTDGPFAYDYTWLTQKYTAQMMKPWADGHFENLFGVSPDTFQCV